MRWAFAALLVAACLSDPDKAADQLREMAKERAEASAAVREKLGDGRTYGEMHDFRVMVSGQSGHAELFVPVSGATASAELHVDAKRENGLWTLTTLWLVSGEETVDLLTGGPADDHSHHH